MQLHYTPRSHFSRKVRLVLAALGLEATLVDVGNVADARAAFGPNPLLKVPTLVDGDLVLFDSDHIARHLARRHDPGDRLGVLDERATVLNARAVMNGAMAADVELVLAARAGIDTGASVRFDKLRATIDGALAWLEANAGVFPDAPSYAGFHLVSLWDHLVLYDLRPLHAYPRLRAIAGRLDALPEVAASRPPA
jgi:glutathione S-transferase